MTNFYVTYSFKNQESRDDFYKSIKKSGIRDLCYDEDGCIRYDYFFPADSDTQLFLWEQWESRTHQEAHCNTPHFKELGELKLAYDASVEMTTEDVL